MLNRSFKTNGYHGYNVKFSPFQTQKLACSASKNYGVWGPGCLFVLSNDFQLLRQYHWKHGLYDLAWSEVNENVILTASADGTIQIWDLTSVGCDPIQVLAGHSKEVCCIDWSQIRSQQLLVSGSWDCTAKIWDVCSQATPIACFGHNDIVYTVVWSNIVHRCFASVSSDGNLRIWNTNSPTRPAIQISAHSAEVLSCDWNKYKQDIVVTASVDGFLKGWDLRMPTVPIFQQFAHEYAIRRVKFSPHDESVLASASYDMTTKVWNVHNNIEVVFNSDLHTEFVYGLDYNLHSPGQIADCSWDEIINVYQLP